MPHQYDAQLRHAKHYAQVAARAEHDLYLKGEVQAALALFDQERLQIDAGWAWARKRAGDPYADALLWDYTDKTFYIGELRYDNRRERIPQLEAALVVAQRRGDRAAEGACIGFLGLTYAALGEVRAAITFFEQRLAIAREQRDRREEGVALGNLGGAYVDLGQAQRGIEFYEQRLAIARELYDRRGGGRRSLSRTTPPAPRRLAKSSSGQEVRRRVAPCKRQRAEDCLFDPPLSLPGFSSDRRLVCSSVCDHST
jgi:tetratricopeptide (TPR) repeat protein